MKKITYEQLVLHKACAPQLELFKETFGDAVEVTEELAVQYAQVFDFGWAAHHLLSDTARAEYYKVRDLALAEYHKVCGTADAEYYKVHDLAWAEYHKVCAVAFVRGYNR